MTPTRFHPPGRLDVPALLAATGGQLTAGPANGTWTLCTDSREMRDGALFVALRGDNFDGHRFVSDVLGRWKAGALVEEAPPAGVEAAGPVILVSDSLVAFGAAAAAVLRQHALPVAAVTGSVGKTTTRAMLASILECSAPGLCTEGNFNNRIGLPLTLLGLNSGHRWVVLEMGMSEPGEIRALAAIAAPTVRVITTVSAGHLEFFDSTSGIADAKGELFESAGPGDTLIFPANQWFTERLPTPAGAQVVTFSTDGGSAADLRLLDWEDRGLDGSRATVDLAGTRCEIALSIAGFHQIHNALAAAGAALAMGASVAQIQQGLAAAQLPGRRMRIEEVAGVTVIDDAYNANPASISAALATLSGLDDKGRRIAVLGDMLELGPSAPSLHDEVGRAAAAAGIDLLVGTGPLMAHAVTAAASAGIEAVAASDSVVAGQLLAARVSAGDVVLFKGSRGMKMELAIEALRPPNGLSAPRSGN